MWFIVSSSIGYIVGYCLGYVLSRAHLSRRGLPAATPRAIARVRRANRADLRLVQGGRR